MVLAGFLLGFAFAAILFRVVYYFVPFAVSLPLYWPLLRAERREETGARGR